MHTSRARSLQARLLTLALGSTLVGTLLSSCLTPSFQFDEEPERGLGGQGSGSSHCDNTARDADETDFNCGGRDCEPCALGRECLAPGDCVNQACSGGQCQDATCTDDSKNGTETDTDCGGLGCAPCGDESKCLKATDCASNICLASECQIPSCDDRVKNGGESDTDCGESCEETCEVGKDCFTEEDCTQPSAGGAFVDCRDGQCALSCLVKSDCEDENECTDHACVDGLCVATNNENPCATDGNQCTSDVCTSGECTHELSTTCSVNTVIMRSLRDGLADQWLSVDIESNLVWDEAFDSDAATLFDLIPGASLTFTLQDRVSGKFVVRDDQDVFAVTGSVDEAVAFRRPACSFEGDSGIALQVVGDDDPQDISVAEADGSISARSSGCATDTAIPWERFEIVALGQ